MKSSQPAQDASAHRPSNWTLGQLLPLVLIVLAASSATGVGAYYGTRFSQSSTCGPGQSLVSGSCANNCSNGATNPPACNTFLPCPNGATNTPQCTYFTSTTTITCSPTSLVSYYINTTSCHIKVYSQNAPTVPTGSVGFNASGTSAWHATGTPCTLTLGVGYSYCDISNVATYGPSGTMTILVGYSGDSTHVQSVGSFSLSDIDPPSMVTVSGSINDGYIGHVPYRMRFIVMGTTNGYNATITGYSNSTMTGYYSINIPNATNYWVYEYYRTSSGTGTCYLGQLNVFTFSNTYWASWGC